MSSWGRSKEDLGKGTSYSKGDLNLEGNAIHGAILPLLMPRDRLYGPSVAQYKRHAGQKVS